MRGGKEEGRVPAAFYERLFIGMGGGAILGTLTTEDAEHTKTEGKERGGRSPSPGAIL